ncbi:MAG TPA: isoleucine--tRNA ligase [Candidatus Saccharimonadales bacterium]|nr:isoleucine--tRNA ligase [Candidatus Saccharimonadales bacterium]
MPEKKHFLAEIEERLLDIWEKEKTFEKSLANRQGGKLFSFYDGPPFANGTPHYGHLEQTTIKDTMTRYKTMRGYYVPRRVGWDTHGLPVEYAIEKEHHFKGKKDIIAYGIDKFNAECRDSVFKYKDVWEKMFRRVGRWADYQNTYATLDESYIESVWWVFKTIYDKGYVYKDFRSSPYCPRCATPLSNFELNQGYQDDVPDPSLYVKFKIKGEEAYLLGWTTTPWSLPGNAAIAVHPEAKYVYVRLADDAGQEETLVVARDRLEALNVETYHIEKELTGQQLVGLEYEPLFELKDKGDNTADLYKVWPAEFVSIEEGSGVLHVAPAFGEDDLSLAKKHNLPVFLTVDENGHIVTNQGLPPEIAGHFFKEADAPIIEHLTKKGLVYAAETFKHTYPFCWRCDTPLLYYATDNWLVRVTDFKDALVGNNMQIKWTPSHIQTGRFGNWLENARDWGISRNRFWGAPLPIWVTDDGELVVIGSVKELKERAVDPSKVSDLHRPYIDDVEIKTDSGKIARRIPEVFDCWFESGSMPYAQDHYPFQNAEEWEKGFPADFVAEAIDQTRGWFYTLHVLGGALFDKPAFQNVICSGWIVAADGEKLSKRKKNYAPMDEVFDQYGVDTMRFFMASSPLMNGEDTRFSVDFLRDVQRQVFMTFNNVFSFYKLYADVDKWQPKNPLKEPGSQNLLDQWILARLNQAIAEVTAGMEDYRLDRASRPIVELLDDISNWYVRRSRRRFWKSEDDADKNSAYETLHYTILRTAQLLAPFAPFLADHIWREMVKGTDLPASVHLSDWPKVKDLASDELMMLENMANARTLITEGLAQRAAASIKVRQPLAKATVSGLELSPETRQIVVDELNVKEVINQTGKEPKVVVDTQLTDELKAEGLSRDLIRFVQNARKNAGFNVDDRIHLRLESDSQEIEAAIKQFKDTIFAETLATGELTGEGEHSEQFKLEGQVVTAYLKRA